MKITLVRVVKSITFRKREHTAINPRQLGVELEIDEDGRGVWVKDPRGETTLIPWANLVQVSATDSVSPRAQQELDPATAPEKALTFPSFGPPARRVGRPPKKVPGVSDPSN